MRIIQSSLSAAVFLPVKKKQLELTGTSHCPQSPWKQRAVQLQEDTYLLNSSERPRDNCTLGRFQ